MRGSLLICAKNQGKEVVKNSHLRGTSWGSSPGIHGRYMGHTWDLHGWGCRAAQKVLSSEKKGVLGRVHWLAVLRPLCGTAKWGQAGTTFAELAGGRLHTAPEIPATEPPLLHKMEERAECHFGLAGRARSGRIAVAAGPFGGRAASVRVSWFNGARNT